MSTKTKKSNAFWFKCEECGINIIQKDTEEHLSSCPPSVDNYSYPYIKAGILNGFLSTKTNEEIKGLTEHDKNNLVFLSQSVIQLCNLVIGDWAVVESDNDDIHCAKIVWPTTEKSLGCVLVTKNYSELNWANKTEIRVTVKKLDITNLCNAREIKLLGLNISKMIQITPELISRIKKLHLNRIITKGNKIGLYFYGKFLQFEIKQIEGFDIKETDIVRNLEKEFNNMELKEKFFKITQSTIIKLFSNVKQIEDDFNITDPLTFLGGIENELNEIIDLVNITLGKSPKISGIKNPKGILLYGNSGTGKTTIANAVAETLNCHKICINTTDLYSKYNGEIENIIKTLFNEAKENEPTLILIDEIDILCPSRTSKITDQEKRIVSILLNQFDEINNKICVLATSSKPDSIDPAFRRSGRLDHEIEIPIPNPKNRLEILKKKLSRIKNQINNEELKKISDISHGFVGSDLNNLCTQASMQAIKNDRDFIVFDDLKFALTRVRPSAMREVTVEVPDVKWSDIGGQEHLKLILRQAVEWPLKHPESFVRMGITPPRGVLMFGPPGCSKTMIAKALATESGLNFLSIKGPELYNKWVGESERAVREVFRKARQVAPAILFFDEIDALGGERSTGQSTGGTSVQERVLAQLLTELDGVTPLGDVTVLAATNRPDRMDKALLRPGRLDRIVYVRLPDKQTRLEIFRIKIKKMPVDNIDLDYLVDVTEGYSGAEIHAVCHEAAMKALEEDINAKIVDMGHFETALKMITPRTPEYLIKMYEEYVKK